MKSKVIKVFQLVPILFISFVLLYSLLDNAQLNDKKLLSLIILPLLIVFYFIKHSVYIIGALIFMLLGCLNFFEYTTEVVNRSFGFPNLNIVISFQENFVLPLIVYLGLSFISIKNGIKEMFVYLSGDATNIEEGEVKYFRKKYESLIDADLESIISSELTSESAKIAARQVLDDRRVLS